ncbi:MAG: hypothetical protein RQ763_06060 [Sulfurimonas sp.]|uniref:hypothetical protein n=1 Tax=Sulfurimonas sp. TaxID=2022749 RepID=UPI0028CCA751|nr:hypothetical protein [Sulfurimonas sp.]MDT8338742.1 hypothetical protein [Sulfurimonas sp.]
MKNTELSDIFIAFGYVDMQSSGTTPLKCTSCGLPLSFKSSNLACDNNHNISYIDFTLDYIKMIESYKADIINGTLDLGNSSDDVPLILEVCS